MNTTEQLIRIKALLNAVEGFEDDDRQYIDDARDAVQKLIEELAAPVQQEPVAWLVYENWREHSLFFTKEGAEDFKNASQRNDDLSGNLARWRIEPLYTSPQPAPAITPEHLLALAQTASLELDKVIAAFRMSEKPAQQEQEPVAIVAEVIGCFDAALAEGLQEALAETTDERLKDLVERRLMYALYAAQEASPQPAQRKPLTDDERRKAFVRWYQTCECLMSPDAIFDQAFQEAEAANNIK